MIKMINDLLHPQCGVIGKVMTLMWKAEWTVVVKLVPLIDTYKGKSQSGNNHDAMRNIVNYNLPTSLSTTPSKKIKNLIMI